MSQDDWPTPIRTARLVLREFRAGDAADVNAYAMDLEVVRFMWWGPNTAEETTAVLARFAQDRAASPRTEFGLAIAAADTDQALGSIGLHLREEGRETAEIGWCLRRDRWGQGLATEAAAALMAAGFQRLGLRRIWASCDARNAASWRVMERLGMRREGLLRQDRKIKGEWRDTLVYAMLAQDREAMGE